MAGVIAREVERRKQSKNVLRSHEVKVWKARLADVREVELVPAVTVPPSLRERKS